MWGGESTGKFSRTDIEHLERVADFIVPLISGNFSLYEVIVNHFQDNSSHIFN